MPGFAIVDHRRSIGIAALAPFGGVPGVQFVSLQKGPAQEQIRQATDVVAGEEATSEGLALFDPMVMAHDFADTAAIIANLDLVISVDTAVVHLAGAMGKPVFMLDRYDNCWRWLSGRADSPWYPGMTIFRQNTQGDWSAPIARATAALEAMAAWHCAAKT